jgi:Predicted esterase of the alpha/beta hydrolase fold
MRNNYFMVHGTFGDASYHWFGWLKKELEKLGYECIAPGFETKEGINNYDIRKKILKDYVDKGIINENTVFIGHSSGPIVVAKFLLEEHINVKGIISVSGFNNADVPYDEYNKINRDFYIDDDNLKMINDYVKFIICYYSDNDPYLNQDDLERFAILTGADKRFISGAMHFNTDSGYTTFFDLLDMISLLK